jgi:hypothetical protein
MKFWQVRAFLFKESAARRFARNYNLRSNPVNLCQQAPTQPSFLSIPGICAFHWSGGGRTAKTSLTIFSLSKTRQTNRVLSWKPGFLGEMRYEIKAVNWLLCFFTGQYAERRIFLDPGIWRRIRSR